LLLRLCPAPCCRGVQARLFEKARLCYKGDIRRVTDYDRRSFICSNLTEIADVTREIEEELGPILRSKNRFARANRTAASTAGYRDCQLLVRAKGTDALLEIQLHLATLYDIKSKVAEAVDSEFRTGHERYIEYRALKEKAMLL
jgi:hypothetical protein